jgi:hypothetical protein
MCHGRLVGSPTRGERLQTFLPSDKELTMLIYERISNMLKELEDVEDVDLIITGVLKIKPIFERILRDNKEFKTATLDFLSSDKEDFTLCIQHEDFDESFLKVNVKLGENGSFILAVTGHPSREVRMRVFNYFFAFLVAPENILDAT